MRRSFPWLFALVWLSLAACAPRAEEPPKLESGVMQVSSGGVDVAELVFEEERLIRVEYETEDPGLRARLDARLAVLAELAEREGLFVRFHEYSDDGQTRFTYGASPKPGERRFVLAMFEHLNEGADFSARAK